MVVRRGSAGGSTSGAPAGRRARRARQTAGAASLALLASGCDPVFDIGGSFFPDWMLCLLAGAALAVLVRLVFARIGIEPHLGPLPVVYGCLGALLTMITWLVFFGT
jgi:hypothetical protein